jgi:hypothetical protein
MFGLLAVLLLVAVALPACVRSPGPARPASTQPAPLTASTCAFGAAVVSIAVSAHRLRSSTTATVTLSVSNITSGTIVAPGAAVNVLDRRGDTVSNYDWETNVAVAGVCERCHHSGPTLAPGAMLTWQAPVVIPSAPGHYRIVGIALSGQTDTQTPPVEFDSVQGNTAMSPTFGALRAWALAPGEAQALRLLAKAHLVPLGPPVFDGGTLTTGLLERYRVSSRASGLNLSRHLGETLQTLGYRVLMPGHVAEASVTASFFVSDGRVVGLGEEGVALIGGSPDVLGSRRDFR